MYTHFVIYRISARLAPRHQHVYYYYYYYYYYYLGLRKRVVSCIYIYTHNCILSCIVGGAAFKLSPVGPAVICYSDNRYLSGAGLYGEWMNERCQLLPSYGLRLCGLAPSIHTRNIPRCCRRQVPGSEQYTVTVVGGLFLRRPRTFLNTRAPQSGTLSPGFYPGPLHQCRLFQTFAKTYLFARY